jgi:toluene monooxygenase system protein A
VVVHGDRKYMLCSEPCEWIFKREPERYAHHKDVVKRILAGEAPGNLIELVQKYFGLTPQTWGKDVSGGVYSWLERKGARP